MDKKLTTKDFVDTSMLIPQAKKTASETDLYVKNLNEIILPRFQSARITSDLVKR